MLRKIIDTITGKTRELDKTNWLFELPEGISDAVTHYHDTKMRHRAEAIEANAVYDKAREKMWADSKAEGHKYASDFPKDHPIQIAWNAASRERDALRHTHNAESKAAHGAMSEEEAKQYDQLWKDWCYSDANGTNPKEHLSPSGKYKLVVTSHETSPGCWSYSKGKVFQADSDEPIAEVRRNYGAFPFLFLEDHMDGHEYLICGEDYQGQTFVQLDTGKLVSDRSFGAERGFGFCWASYRLLGDGKTLLVDGCYWACPYELKFFDVSDPMKGWPELELPYDDLDYLDPEKSEVKVEGDTIVWEERGWVYKETGERHSEIDHAHSRLLTAAHKARHQKAGEEVVAAAEAEAQEFWDKYNMDDEPDEDPERWEQVVDRRVTLRIEGGEFVLAEDWKSDWQLEQERLRQEYRERDRAQRQKWLDEDELFQHLVGAHGRSNLSVGYSYPSMVMRWDGDPNPAYLRISLRDSEEDASRTAALQWGVTDGPIQIEMWVRGRGNVKKPEFPRSLEGIQAAWDAAHAHIEGGA